MFFEVVARVVYYGSLGAPVIAMGHAYFACFLG
jgi:hypothetical protein